MTDDGFHLTALDVRRYDFGNALRGYDRSRVDQFRDQVAEEIERLTRANQELDQKARNFHEQLRAFRERDKALNDALVSAQQLRGDIREQAEREALLIIREARATADVEVQQVRDELRRTEEELQQLWRARRSYLAQLRNHVERQLTELVSAEGEPPPPFVHTRDPRGDYGGDPGRGSGAPSASHAQPHAQPHVQPHAQPHVQPHVQSHVQSHAQSQSTPDSQAHGSSQAAPTIPVAPPSGPRAESMSSPPMSPPMSTPTSVHFARDLNTPPPTLQELRDLPPRAPSPTPSWLDAIDDQ